MERVGTDVSYLMRRSERLIGAALVATAIAALSARHDYESREELGGRTQALMWPAYVLGAVAIADTQRRSGNTGTAASRALGLTTAAAGLALFAAGAAPFQSFSQLAGRDPGGLITEGIYAKTRNPQYLGNVLLAVGSAVTARSAAAATFAARFSLATRGTCRGRKPTSSGYLVTRTALIAPESVDGGAAVLKQLCRKSREVPRAAGRGRRVLERSRAETLFVPRGEMLVLINIAFRSATTCVNGIKHSAYPELDNCHRDYAQRNATELADLLKV